MTKCKKCGATIIFAIVVGGKKDGRWMPLDRDPVENGRWHVYRSGTDPRGALRCKFMDQGTDWPVGSVPRNPHWMTCPAAEEFRRKRAEGSRSAKTPEEERRRIEEFVVHERRREVGRATPEPKPQKK